MKTLYLDIFSGISGDMFIGAMLDLGVDFDQLSLELNKLGLAEFHVHAARGQKASIEGVKFDVHSARDHESEHELEHAHAHEHQEPKRAHSLGQFIFGLRKHQATHDQHHHPHGHEHEHGHSQHEEHGHESERHHDHGRTFLEIKELIGRSALSPWVKEKSIGVFTRIAIAEGKIHGQPPESVHFHEVGAIDSIVDIVGAAAALELLGKPRVLAAIPIEGRGFIECAHGHFPIPAPATLAILGQRNIPLTQCAEEQELITPTGAAILAEFVDRFGPMQNLAAEKIGYGLGTRDNKTRPNVLRAILGESKADSSVNDWETDTVAVLETNLDNVSSELLGHFTQLAFQAGALDVFYVPIQMKKNRPGVLLTVLCPEDTADSFTELILRETTALGVRRSKAERRKLRREVIAVQTVHGEVSVKLGRLNGRVIQAAPEFESCRKIAAAANVPLKQVYEAAQKALPTSTHD